MRAGRSVVVTECWFRDDADGEPLAYALATFVPSPDPTRVFPDGFPLAGSVPVAGSPLRSPTGSGVGVVEPGIVEMPRRPDGLNAVGAIQGGVASVAIEEAVTSLTVPAEAAATHSCVRYLRPVMQGPALAVAIRGRRRPHGAPDRRAPPESCASWPPPGSLPPDGNL